MTNNHISLAQKHPELAKQADGWDPTTITAGSGLKLPWKCEFEHRWESSVNNRAKGRGCPICAGKQVLAGFNDLATTHPDLAKEADGWDPTTFRPGSNKNVSWKCGFGHAWLATVNNRSAGRGCPICFGKKVLTGFNDLATTHPHLAKEAHGWDPRTVSKGTQKKFKWNCPKGHVYVAGVANRTGTNQTSCPICAGKQIQIGFNDLATTNPDLASQAHGWDPQTKAAFSGKKAEWECAEGHVWTAVIASRSSGRGCPICAGKQVLPGFNDLATKYPEIAKEAFEWNPGTISAGSHQKFTWVCTNGHKFSASPHSRTGHNKTGCIICSGQQVLSGFNDLATTHPAIAVEAHEWDPRTVNAGSNPKKRWKCSLGHTWMATPNSRTGPNQSGCPTCSQTGFDPNETGFLYFIDHFDLHMYQIGITNFPDDRLRNHKRRGWEVIELRGPMDGHLTQKLETDCLHALVKRGAVMGHKAGIEKFDGYSEAWTKASLDVASIKQILDWVYEDESK